MTKKKRWAGFCAALFIGAALPWPARAELKLSLRLYAGGYNAVNVTLALDRQDDRYHIVTELRTNGFADIMLRLVQYSEVAGDITDGIWRPRSFVSRSDGRFGHRTVVMSYMDGHPVISELDPPQEQDDRDTVSEAEMRATVDPMTAVTAAIAGNADSPCQGTMPIFDGRRRYNLKFDVHAEEDLPLEEIGGFSGRALRCDIIFEPVAGFARQQEAETRAARPPAKLWLARLGTDRRWLPVKLITESTFGRVVTHLEAAREGEELFYKKNLE